MKTKAWLLIPGMILILVTSGCIFSPKDDPSEDPPSAPESPYDPSTTPDIMVENFKKIYEEGDIDAYREILHDDYLFILKHSIGDADFFNYDTELVVAQKMFSGAAGADGAPAIVAIRFDYEALGVWVDTPTDEAHFGGYDPPAKFRDYTVDMYITRQTDTDIIVRGSARFYAITDHTQEIQGQQKPIWQLLGQRDNTNE